MVTNLFYKPIKLPRIANDSLKSMSKGLAITEIVGEYVEQVNNKQIIYPAYKRENASVIEVWTDTRIEAFYLLVKSNDIDMLSDFTKQKEIIEYYFQYKPHLQFPYTISEDTIHNTIQAIYNSYLYIEKIAYKTFSNNIINFVSQKQIIFNNFESKMQELKIFYDDSDNNIPPILIFDFLYKDITEKTKEIALSNQFSSDYKNVMDKIISTTIADFKKDGLSDKKIVTT